MMSKITIRVSQAERDELQRNASAANLSVSEYVRRRCSGARVYNDETSTLLASMYWLGYLLESRIEVDPKIAGQVVALIVDAAALIKRSCDAGEG